jgi:predicted MFS family arabinose efflux permease
MAAECISAIGTELSLVATSIAILTTGGTGTDLGIVLMARVLPPIVVLVFGSVLVDRVSRGRILVLLNVLAMTVQILLAVEMLSGGLDVSKVALLQAALGASTALMRPAAIGTLPQIVVPGDEQRATSVLAMSGNVASIVGPASAGLLLLCVEASTLILFDAVTFALAAAFVGVLWRLPPAAERGRQFERGYWRQLRTGWLYVMRTRWLCVTVAQQLVVQACFAMFFVIGPVMAEASSRDGSLWAGMVTAFGVGAAGGSVIAYRYRPRVPLLAMQLILILSVPLFAALASPLPFAAAIPGAFLAGAALSLAETIWCTFLQTTTPNAMLGRVVATTDLASAALRPFGYLFAGAFTAEVSATPAFGFVGALLLGSIVVTALVLFPIRANVQTAGAPRGAGARR